VRLGKYISPFSILFSIDVVAQGTNIPDGATVELQLVSEKAPDQILTQTLAVNLATFTGVILPSGFSRGFVSAHWDSPASP